MNTQANSVATWVLQGGRAQRVGQGAGELRVVEGRVWVTGQGDGEDHVLSPGECLSLPDAGAVVVEAWDRGQGAVVRWQPRHSWLQAFGLRGLVATAFAALARKAASSASRAQGCISAGDSMASSGAVK